MSVSTVIVTGAAAGVGRALVGLLLDRGMTVIASDIDEPGLASLRDAHAGRPLAVSTCDVGVRAECDAFMERTLAAFPQVDGLVNNAGLYLGRPVWDYDDTTIERVIAVNVKGPVWLSRAFAGHLLPHERRGAIVNLASVAGEVGSSDALYGTVKAGVIGLTKSNAMNFAPYIRVNVVSPGLIVNTAIADRIPEYRYKEYKRQEMLDYDILPEDVARICAYALSDDAKSMTGAVLRADNGCYPR
ncbi:SDR family NAD(P)-dependent oxidoreductase [Salinarimonas ramus]|uniref:3-oxoacyl-[acyl-carrier-protein] reductase n=1 Tax=Salinarimonas ramus TaxID=690164 RepID=A0A917QGF2_9HYPH|nr:SDR family oxidoreductase [Salinarimonas ramus]GGK49518.1 3-oxoacyl-[acyl-carrier-protein] reductase [Salinarimonas ramus]